MKFNPNDEAEYRADLAKEFLEDASTRLEASDFRGCVQSAQLTAENAAKAIIATKRTPSWAHDPSPELSEVSKGFQPEFSQKIDRLGEIVKTMAPEHGRTTYGEPEHFKTPRSLYDAGQARRALAFAKEAIEIMNVVLQPQEEKRGK